MATSNRCWAQLILRASVRPTECNLPRDIACFGPIDRIAHALVGPEHGCDAAQKAKVRRQAAEAVTLPALPVVPGRPGLPQVPAAARRAVRGLPGQGQAAEGARWRREDRGRRPLTGL